MTETIYTFVKGRGWIVVNNVISFRGDNYNYEFRPPTSGERYLRMSKKGDRSPDSIINFSGSLSTARGGNQEYIDGFERFDFCVLTPLFTPSP